MSQHRRLPVLSLLLLWLIPTGVTRGQLPDRLNPQAAAAGGVSNPRGIDLRNSPIANPPPALTPSEVLNPRGSLSPGQVLKPTGSLDRPRTGGGLPEANVSGPPATGPLQTETTIATNGSSTGETTTRGVANQAGSSAASQAESQASMANLPVGERVLLAVVALDSQITKVAPNQDWASRLSLDALRTVPVLSEQPANDKQRSELEAILKAYKAFEDDTQAAAVNQLPEFKQVLTTLMQYLSPLEIRQRVQASAALKQLARDLDWYKNGGEWAEYLIPKALATDDVSSPLPDELLAKQLKRYAKVSADPFYKKVAGLPGFKPAYTALRTLSAAESP